MIYVPILTSKKPRYRWHINYALIAKFDCMFLKTDLQVAINLKNRLDFFFIVEIIDFYLKKKVTHPNCVCFRA